MSYNYPGSRPDEIRSWVGRYVTRTGGRNALHNDPQYAAEIHQLTRIFEMLDMAMENEDVPKKTRDRVIRACVFGTPDFVDAEIRMKRNDEQIKRLMETAPFIDTTAFREMQSHKTTRGI
jgi:L-asparaginase II